jgi:hypothetical protein
MFSLSRNSPKKKKDEPISRCSGSRRSSQTPEVSNKHYPRSNPDPFKSKMEDIYAIPNRLLELKASGTSPNPENKTSRPLMSAFAPDLRKGVHSARTRGDSRHRTTSFLGPGEIKYGIRTNQDKEIESHLNTLAKSFAFKRKYSVNMSQSMFKLIHQEDCSNHQTQPEAMINDKIQVNNLSLG